MNIEFSGELWKWKGPAPWHFVTVPARHCDDIKALASGVTHGWGMVPAKVRVGNTEWETSLWPNDDSYIVPIKASVRKAEKLQEGDTVTVQLGVR